MTTHTDEFIGIDDLLDEFVSPYRLAQVASVLTGTYVREQMLYQYTSPNKKGKVRIPCTRVDGKKMVAKADAIEWLSKYVPAKIEKDS